MNRARLGRLCLILFTVLAAAFAAPPSRAGTILLSPEAKRAQDMIYGGNPDAAIPLARAIQQAQPDHPLGYLLEAEALWWKRYCAACEMKYGMVEPWKHGKDPGDPAFLALADKVVELAQARLAKSETAEMYVYAGMGLALKVRVYGLRNENRNAARAGVAARAEMLRALQLDPQMADATAALGLYNYYVDSLPLLVRVLRFFTGIPAGDKVLGVAQMEVGMNQGVLLATDIRFILARSLRQFDQKYEEALTIAQPLAEQYPANPMFLLLIANLNAELGRNEEAAKYFRAAANVAIPDSICAARVRAIAAPFLAAPQ